MKKYYKRIVERKDKKNILIYGYNKHKEKINKELEITLPSKPHIRWHPLRQEWVAYSSGRDKRTFFPLKKYCPFCPSAKIKYPTEIPFKSFKIAIFPNRWSSFNSHNEKFYLKKVTTKISKGACEVVVYSDKHEDTIASMQTKKIELLIDVWNDRYIELLKHKDIKYVMPFENRGVECGVTLHHPHGQIYTYPFIPPVIKKEIKAFKKQNYLINLMKDFEKKYWVYKNKDVIAVVPPFARYTYEVWIIPRKKIPGPWAFDKKLQRSFAICLKKVIKGYDNFLKKRCPYIMGLHAAPTLNDKNFHFHIEFYPPLRSKNQPKILAGSESMAGVFIMDMLPEETSLALRKHII